MRLIFIGSGEFGLPTLRRLHADHTLAAVVTQPDRPAGRHQHLTPTAVGAAAAAAGLNVLKVENINTDAVVAQIQSLAPEAAVIIAFGQKLSPALLGALGPLAINLHASVLPKFRGAAPISWAILTGQTHTGLSVISLAQKMDAGLIYAQCTTPIDPQETAGELHDRLAELGPDLVSGVLHESQQGAVRGWAQDETQATSAPKLSRADGWVDFAQGAATVAARVHGLTPWPGVCVNWQSSPGAARQLILRRVAAEPGSMSGVGAGATAAPGQVLEGQRVAVRDGAVRLLEVQLPGGKPMAIDAFVRGHRLHPGDNLAGASAPAGPSVRPASTP
jgi:methionyl-tRNA formyltransferase